MVRVLGCLHWFLCIEYKKLAFCSTRHSDSRSLPRTPVRFIGTPVRWIAVTTCCAMTVIVAVGARPYFIESGSNT